MNGIIAFFSRCLLYTVFVVVSKFENSHVQFDMFQRVVLTCLQICVLCGAWVTYECCAFIIRSVSRPVCYDELHASAEAVEQADDLIDKNEAPEDADKLVPAEDTTVSFASKKELRKYIMQVHTVGIVLWSTMLCSDYALEQTAFMFLLGMLLGNIASVSCKVYKQHMRASKMRMYAVYWVCIGVLVMLYLAHDGSKVILYTENQLGIRPTNIAWTDALWVLNVLFSPLSCGCTWTFWVDANTLLEHYPTSIYTCLLLSIPVIMSVDRAYITNICIGNSAILTVHLFITEPVLKFMTMYVLTLSLEVESVIDVLVVNSCVSGVCYVIYSSHNELFDAVVGLLITLLLLFHLTRLILQLMRHKKDVQFSVE
jgi:hypothetical protein